MVSEAGRRVDVIVRVFVFDAKRDMVVVRVVA